MKQKETLLTTPLSEQKIELSHLIMEEMGDEHKASSVDTPLRADAFDKTDEEKIALIEPHFRAIPPLLLPVIGLKTGAGPSGANLNTCP